jgi:glucosyl-3-phosphoglycerate synthase
VARLLVTPLIRTLQEMLGYLDMLIYLDSFRYPLAGEFCMIADLARINEIPGDWGIEIGVLAEVFRNCSTRRICQVDLCQNYEHRHRPLSPDDPSTGMFKMAIDIARTLFFTLAAEGVVLTEKFFKTLKVTYLRAGNEAIDKYNDDAIINSLPFDRHQEGVALETFLKAVEADNR